MVTLTSIGYIDASNTHHVEFALLALEHKHNIECEASYVLWKSDMLDVAVITQQRADTLMTEIMHLKHTNNY